MIPKDLIVVLPLEGKVAFSGIGARTAELFVNKVGGIE